MKLCLIQTEAWPEGMSNTAYIEQTATRPKEGIVAKPPFRDMTSDNYTPAKQRAIYRIYSDGMPPVPRPRIRPAPEVQAMRREQDRALAEAKRLRLDRECGK